MSTYCMSSDEEEERRPMGADRGIIAITWWWIQEYTIEARGLRELGDFILAKMCTGLKVLKSLGTHEYKFVGATKT